MTISEIRDDNFGAVLNCAVRYALGRSSYTPLVVVGYISPMVENLSNKTLWCLKRDINEAATHDNLGDPIIDAPLWLSLLEDVKKELIRRGKD